MKPDVDCSVPENLERRAAAWISAFTVTRGRVPRVLHIGNIANNAYNNAKLLNRMHLDCDVLCFDYYHIMGCPEWEDADFDGRLNDQFFPDWNQIDLRGFQRPEWFVQGPMMACLAYLTEVRRPAPVPPHAPPWRARWREARRLWLRARLTTARKRALVRHRSVLRQFLKRVRVPLPNFGAPRIWWPLSVRAAAKSVVGHFAEGLVRLFLSFVAIVALTLAIVVWAIRSALRPLRRFRAPAAELASNMPCDFDRRVQELTSDFRRQFPDRSDSLEARDLEPYRNCFEAWRRLLINYDAVIGYSTDGIYPLLAGIPYFAFEHGTLREIPFQPTAQGRLAALTYRLAEHAFVTNADCIENARQLRCVPTPQPPKRKGDGLDAAFTFLNHPYDEDHGLQIDGWRELRQRLQHELQCEHLILFPTRHDWVPGTGYADKANDVLLRAFADLRRSKQLPGGVGLVCCEWGANVEDSRRLLRQLGCEQFVRWVQPMGVVQFDRMVRACDVVADQFKLGAFGGVLFKALANGTPVCTYLDEAALKRNYDEVPPVLNCPTTEQIVAQMTELFTNAASHQILRERSRRWMKHYHRGSETAAKQVLAFADSLAPELLDAVPDSLAVRQRQTKEAPAIATPFGVASCAM